MIILDKETIDRIKNYPKLTTQLKGLEDRLRIKHERVPKKEVDDMLNNLMQLANITGVMMNQPSVFMVGMKSTVKKTYLGVQATLDNMVRDFNNKDLYKLEDEAYWVYIGGNNV